MIKNILFALTALTALSNAQGPPVPPNYQLPGTQFVNASSVLSGYYAQTFLRQNIPFIDIPDSAIQSVYYFRWYSLTHHLNYATQGTGYAITEFVQPVSYSGAFNTIDAAAGHQIEEARWLRNPIYAQDDIQIFTRGVGDGKFFTHWIHHAIVAAANVTGDTNFLNSQLSGMVELWHEWDDVFLGSLGLYYYTPNQDAQEYSLPGYILDPQGTNGLQRDGPFTARPSHNAYMFANAQAIAFVANAVGKTTVASQFATYASNIQNAMYQNLWNKSQQFFVDNIIPGYSQTGQVNGREAVGFYPFRFGIGLDNQYVAPTLRAWADPQGFNTSYYPPTLEVRNQYFTAPKPSQPPGYCCFWQGQNWPFSTAHFLKSLAAIHRFNASAVSSDLFYAAMVNYAETQMKNGRPWIAESHYAENSSWSQDQPDHSEFYQHSTNNDNVLSDLLGVRPRADNVLEISPIIPSTWTYFAVENLTYHGQLLTILYDQNGKRYNQGCGLTIFLSGKKVHNEPGPSATYTLPASTASAAPMLDNVASNPYGAGNWPQISATYTWEYDNVFQAIDGLVLYDEVPNNRWSNYDPSGAHTNDTLSIRLPRARNLTGITLAIFSDVAQKTNGSVDVPSSVIVTDGTGKQLAKATTFAPNDINIIPFGGETVLASKININIFARTSKAVAITEAQLWVPANVGPVYYAADGLASGGDTVAFDTFSTATDTGAVMGTAANASGSVVFPGIYYTSPEGGSVTTQLTYKNNDTAPVSVRIVVNRVALQQNVTLPTTTGRGSGYSSLTLPSLPFVYGRNYVTVQGGGSGLFLETIRMG